MKVTRPRWLSFNLVLVLWAITAVFGWLGPGNWLAETIEGVVPAQIPLWPRVVFALLLIDSIVATVWWAMTISRASSTPAIENPGASAQATDPAAPKVSGRRRFLTGSAAMTGGLLGVAGASYSRVAGWREVVDDVFSAEVESLATNPLDLWEGAHIRQYRPLGNTGLKVSDISAGSTRLHQNPEPVKFLNAMLDRGVNYIDASPDYAPQSEEIIRDALRGRDRNKLVIATKFCEAAGHLREGSSVKSYMQAMESAITRLGTDYIDVAHIHSCDSVARLMDENVHEAVDRLREQGKVRFMGVSTHTPNLEEVANTAIDSGRFQVMMLAYHHGAWPHQTDIIQRAAEKGIGIVAMKTLKGAKHNGLADFRKERDSYTQAAFKWVLSNPAVSNLVISFYNDQHLDEYLFASGKSLTDSDVAVLDKYDNLIAGTHCFQHCNACQGACPEAVPIHDVLRHRMYFEDYGDQKQAMQLYARLEQNASACVTCNAPCTGACPENIPIRARVLGAHEMLT